MEGVHELVLQISPVFVCILTLKICRDFAAELVDISTHTLGKFTYARHSHRNRKPIFLLINPPSSEPDHPTRARSPTTINHGKLHPGSRAVSLHGLTSRSATYGLRAFSTNDQVHIYSQHQRHRHQQRLFPAHSYHATHTDIHLICLQKNLL